MGMLHNLRYKGFLLKQFLSGILFTLFIKKYKLDGLRFSIPFKLTDIMFRGRFLLDMYEKEERTYLNDYLDKNATVLELGACLGVISCITNKLLTDPTKHVVVEANPLLIEWIEENKIQNNCKFHVEQCMVTSTKENEFYIHDLIVGGSSVRKTPKKVTVPGKTISELEEQYSLNFDTLIMDIEGGEVELIKENRSKLKQFNKIFMEVHLFAGILTEEEVKTCEKILAEEGFKLIKRDGYFQVWENRLN